MADTLARLAGPANLASGSSTPFTGVAAHIYTIRDITIVNNTAGAITVKLGINGIADSNLILPDSVIDPGGMAVFSGMLVLSGTDFIEVHTSATGLTFSMHGLDQG